LRSYPLDVLLASAAVVVEADDTLGRPRQVGDDEANPRAKLARMPLDLGHHLAGCSMIRLGNGNWRSSGPLGVCNLTVEALRRATAFTWRD
jgi:hypothetical protein